jgi:hypothetical protein
MLSSEKMGDGVGVETDNREFPRDDTVVPVYLGNQTAQSQHPEADADGVAVVVPGNIDVDSPCLQVCDQTKTPLFDLAFR